MKLQHWNRKIIWGRIQMIHEQYSNKMIVFHFWLFFFLYAGAKAQKFQVA